MSIRTGYFWFKIGSRVKSGNGTSGSIIGKKCFDHFSHLRTATVNFSLVKAINVIEQLNECG